MPSIRLTRLRQALLAALVCLPCAATAQERAPDAGAPPSGRACSGTLCDFYYNNLGFGGGQTVAPTTDAPPAPPPARRATSPEPAMPLQGEGSGLIGMMRGSPDTGCSGTLCSLFGGRTAPTPPPGETASTPAPAQAPAALASGAAPAQAAPPQPAGPDPTTRTVKARCAAPAGDPWRCYR